MLYRYSIVLLLLCSLLSGAEVRSQCGDSIDLNTWIKEGTAANGNWTVNAGGNSVTQSINGNPTFFVSPDSFINVILRGNIRVNTNDDDDWIGFVFGYNGPDSTTTNYDFHVFSWKQQDQNFSGYFGSEGYTLAKVTGAVTNFPEAFSSFTGPFVTQLGTQYGNTQGYNDFQTYAFALTYTNTRTVISIDGDTIFDIYGCFPPGRFGFYNYSQLGVIYSDFTYKVAAAFRVITPDVCAGDTAHFVAMSDSCENAAGVPLNNTLVGWEWDFGDGNTSTDTNASHVYDSAGVYTVSLVVTDYLGCKDTAYSSVEIYGFTIDLGPDTAVCENEGFLLDAGAGFNAYAWSTGATSQTYNATAAGTYFVTASGAFGCAAEDSVTITDIAVPLIDLGPDTTICVNTPITLDATFPNATYLWHDASTDSIFQLNSAGDYHVTITYNTGCSDTDTVVVDNFASPTVSPPNPSLCYGDTLTISAAGAQFYQWYPSAGLTDTVGDSVQTFTLVSTTYHVVGTDTNGCIDTADFFVTVTPLPTASISGGDTVCQNDSVQLSVALTGVAPWDITVTDGTGTFTFNGIATSPFTFMAGVDGTYQVTVVTDSGCTNMGSDSTVVVVNPLPTAAITPASFDLCINSSTSLVASGGITYQWTNIAGISATAGSTVTVNPTVNTTYAVEVTDANGCMDSAFSSITILPLPTVDYTIVDDQLCLGQSTTFTASGANSYIWSNVSGLNVYTGSVVTASPQVTSVYTVTGTGSNGCTNTYTDTLVIDTLPIVRVSPSDTGICIGETTSLTATGATTYAWSPGTALSATTGANVNATPAASVTYTVLGTDANGCQHDTTVTVTVFNLPNVTVNPVDPEMCFGQTTNFTASGALSYVWTNTNGLNFTTGANVTSSATTSQVYEVVGTDTNGCVNSATTDLTVFSLPTVSITQNDDEICVGQNVNLQALGAPVMVWNNTAGLSSYVTASVVASPMLSSTYTVVGTDNNGCTSSASAFIQVNALPVVFVSPSSTQICFGDAASLTAAGASTYAWSPATGLSATSGASLTAGPSVTTSYNVLGTDSNGCQNDTDVVVTVIPLPVLSLGSSASIVCTRTNDTLSVSGALTYVWSPSQGMINPNSATPIVSPVSTTTYTVTATGTGGCTSTSSITVQVHPIPNYSAGSDIELCVGDTGQLDATGGVSYLWESQGSISDTTISDPNVYPVSTITYRVTITDQFGCQFDDEVRAVVHPLPIVKTGGDREICKGDSIQIGGNPTGPSGSTFRWSPGNTLSNTLIPNPFANPKNTTQYNIKVTSDKGCVNQSFLTVHVNLLPVVEFIEKPKFACYNSQVEVEVTPGYTEYTWSPQTWIAQDYESWVILQPKENQTYDIEVKDSNGCASYLTYELEVKPLPDVRAIQFPEMCEDDTLEVWAKGALEYDWTPGIGLADSATDSTIAYPELTTEYVVVGTDSHGCQDSRTVLVFVHPRPEIDAGEDIENCDKTGVYLGTEHTAPGDAFLTWSPDSLLDDAHSARPRVIDTERTMYYLHAISPFGCESEDSVFVNSDCYEQVYVPNAFTPDGDEINDVFLYSYWRAHSFHLVIRDRLGHVVFESQDPDVGWNGKFDNLYDAPIGVYYWLLTYKSEVGRSMSKEGTLSLIR